METLIEKLVFGEKVEQVLIQLKKGKTLAGQPVPIFYLEKPNIGFG